MEQGQGELLAPVRPLLKNQHLVFESLPNPPSLPMNLLACSWLDYVAMLLWKQFISLSKLLLADINQGKRTHMGMLCFLICGMGSILGVSCFLWEIHKSIPITFTDGRTQRKASPIYPVINSHVKVLWWRRDMLLSRYIKFTATF